MWYYKTQFFCVICRTQRTFKTIPLMPTEGAPAATAASAYSIWTSLPDGLQKKTNPCYNVKKIPSKRTTESKIFGLSKLKVTTKSHWLMCAKVANTISKRLAGNPSIIFIHSPKYKLIRNHRFPAEEASHRPNSNMRCSKNYHSLFINTRQWQCTTSNCL